VDLYHNRSRINAGQFKMRGYLIRRMGNGIALGKSFQEETEVFRGVGVQTTRIFSKSSADSAVSATFHRPRFASGSWRWRRKAAEKLSLPGRQGFWIHEQMSV